MAETVIARANSKTPQVEAKQQQAAAKDAQIAALHQYATLTAPFDGVVTKKLFKQGQLSLPGQPLLVVPVLCYAVSKGRHAQAVKSSCK